MVRWRASPWAALIVLTLGLFMALLDVTIVSVAIPQLVVAIHASLDQAAWVSTAYMLGLAVLLVTSGRLGDRFGPRAVFLAGAAVFTAASAACGLAASPGALIAARAVQGIGAALLTPQPLTIVTGLFPAGRRGAAFAANGVAGGLATLAGPLIGGLLVTHLSWRWVFFVNVPVGALALVATVLVVPDVRTGHRHRLDLTGVLLASLGLAAVAFALTEGQRFGWGTITSVLSIPLLLAAGAGLLMLFVLQQARSQHRDPLVPFALFTGRGFTLMNAVGAGLQFAFIGFLLPFTLYLQSVLGLSALQAGLVTAPSAVANMALSPFTGRWVDRHGPRGVLTAGLLAFAAGIGILVRVATVGQSPWAFSPAMLVIGVGFAATFSPMITKAMASVPPERAGAASGILSTSRQAGAVVGSALVAAVLQNQLASALRGQALARTRYLPAGIRARLLAAVAGAARSGLQVGAGQSGIRLPGGLPAPLAAAVRRTAAQVYQQAYVAALGPSLLLCAGVLLITAVCAFAARPGRTATTQVPAQASPRAPARH